MYFDGTRGAVDIPNNTITLQPMREIMSALFVLVKLEAQLNTIVPGAATNWIINMVAILNTNGTPKVSAAKAPAIPMTV